MIGDDQKPGAGRGNVTLATVRPNIVARVCDAALSTMMVANTYASKRVPIAPRATRPDSASKTTQAMTKPASHSPNWKVGIGHHPNCWRSATTVGLYTARNPVLASSNTCRPSATQSRIHACRSKRFGVWLSSSAQPFLSRQKVNTLAAATQVPSQSVQPPSRSPRG